MEGHKPSSSRDYLVAGLVAVVLLVLFSCYLFIRRGYFFDAPLTADVLYVPNKAIAGVGMVLLAFIFLIGPIVRYFDRFDKWLGLRKELGIVGAFLIAAHGIISYFSLPKKFPREYMSFLSLEFTAGLIGAALLVFLFVISFRKMIELIGAARWWFFQRWGLRIVILLAVLHVFDMKWVGWVKWLTKTPAAPTAELANPWMPGLGLYVGMFLGWVVIVRLYEMLFLFKNIGLSSKEISTDPILKARGRKFFLGSLLLLVIMYVVVALRWVL
ncbi:MAG: hypothetical protein WAT81_00570 [Candidatus Moraniibacteriota bacterium]